MIAIDGRGGAGKTTLAERFRRTVPDSVVVHTDDVAWNHAYFDWGAVLAENVLQPVHRGEAVDFRPAAWLAHDRRGSITVAAGAEFVWVEGTGAIRAELAAWFDAGMWLQGDLDEQERLLAARDGDSPEQQAHERAVSPPIEYVLSSRELRGMVRAAGFEPAQASNRFTADPDSPASARPRGGRPASGPATG